MAGGYPKTFYGFSQHTSFAVKAGFHEGAVHWLEALKVFGYPLSGFLTLFRILLQRHPYIVIFIYKITKYGKNC